MRYLVTGGLGFIGSEICRQLLQMPTTSMVTVIDDDSKGYGTRNIEDFKDNPAFKWEKYDLTGTFLHTIIHDYVQYSDYVINCAAKIGGIGYFNKIPAQILRNNNLILSNILDAMVSCGTKRAPRLTYMSSSMVFESAIKFPSAEEDLKNTIIPKSAYGFSKLSGEFYCTAFAQEYGLDYTIVRPFNAVGPEKPDPDFVGYSHVLPDFVCKIKNGQGTPENPLQILGAGNQVRHYTDVKEIAAGIIVATHHEKALNNDFNIAIDKGHTVFEVAHLVWCALNPFSSAGVAIKHVDSFPHDVQYRSPDTSKAKEVLEWEAKVTLDNNIDEIVESVLELL